jgi:cytochrome c-type biogenesis protein CcmH/NrfG
MKAGRLLLMLAALGAVLRPELPRYGAERRLRIASDAFQILLDRSQPVEDPVGALGRVAEIAESVGAALPGDSRPWVLAGSAHLTAGRPERALELYRAAFDRAGERAEVDVNVGRARTLLDQIAQAHAAFLRAGWISPALLATLPAPVADPLRAEVARLEAELKGGRLKAPPPPPFDVSR